MTLTQEIITSPALVEHRLVTALAEVADRAMDTPEIKAGLTSAQEIPPGLVIASEPQAERLADSMRFVVDAEKALALREGVVLRIPKQMIEAVRQRTAPTRDLLTAAKKRGNDARVAWQAELRRRAAEEQARREREAAEAAAAAAEGTPFGAPEPPPLEVAPVEVPRTVAGGAGKSGTQVRTEPAEIVDLSACPVEWLVLQKAVARAVFLSDAMQGKVKRPGPGESIVYKGVRFEGVEYAVNR